MYSESKRRAFYINTESCCATMVESDQYLMDYEHAHMHYELLFIFTPTHLRHTYSGRVSETTTPCIMLHAPYALHSTHTLSTHPYRRYKIDFHPCMLTKFGGICSLGRLAGQANCVFPVTEADLTAIEPLIVRIIALTTPGRKPPLRQTAALLSVILSETEALAPVDLPMPISTPPYIQEVLNYVVENIGEPLGVADLAQKFFCSPSKLSRDFRAATALSVHEYVTATRIAHAKLWLREDIPIAQIAQQCGFAQEATFIRMFRQRCGVTPGEYRK